MRTDVGRAEGSRAGFTKPHKRTEARAEQVEARIRCALCNQKSFHGGERVATSPRNSHLLPPLVPGGPVKDERERPPALPFIPSRGPREGPLNSQRFGIYRDSVLPLSFIFSNGGFPASYLHSGVPSSELGAGSCPRERNPGETEQRE